MLKQCLLAGLSLAIPVQRLTGSACSLDTTRVQQLRMPRGGCQVAGALYGQRI